MIQFACDNLVCDNNCFFEFMQYVQYERGATESSRVVNKTSLSLVQLVSGGRPYAPIHFNLYIMLEFVSNDGIIISTVDFIW